MNTPMLAAAVRNNALWCDAVCRAHGLAGTFAGAAWRSARRTPPYYPDAVTLRPGATTRDVLGAVDVSTGCSVKDSFAALDLGREGFTELFGAQWVHRPAGRAGAAPVRRVTTPAGLRAWQDAWNRGGGPDVFRPALLGEPGVRVLCVHDGGTLRGGAVLNHAAGLVGVSNVFAADGTDPVTVRRAVTTAAAGFFPGVPLAGYESGDDLTDAQAAGFTPLGPLRVWLRAG